MKVLIYISMYYIIADLEQMDKFTNKDKLKNMFTIFLQHFLFFGSLFKKMMRDRRIDMIIKLFASLLITRFVNRNFLEASSHSLM